MLYRVSLMLVLLVLGGPSAWAQDAVVVEGKRIYELHCASCHGKEGQGVADRYEKPLGGKMSAAELADLIAETMPEDDPEKCEGKDAQAVAAYVHQTFYNREPPAPRRRVARLTGTQLRQSLADLFQHFGGAAQFTDRNGLQGEYYNSSRPRRDKRKLERIDPTLDFDFKDQGPGEGISADDFSIQWTGGLRVDQTGRYELVLRSTCAFVCFLGSDRREFINNHVQSGDKTEFRRSLMLTAGRVYPLRIEFYQRKRKTEQPPARFTLAWKPPHGSEQVIPTRHLLPERFAPTFSLQTPLPADDRSYGYERGIAVDRQWDDSTTAAAIEFAEYAADELWPRYRQGSRGRGRQADPDRQRLREFLVELAATAFRGPLEEPLRKLYVEGPIAATQDDAEAIKRSTLMILKSPRFLYPLLDQDRSPSQRAANRLALTLYDSLPADPWLIQAAQSDNLKTREQVRRAAERMVNDYRMRGKTREMLYAWLNLDQLHEIDKDNEAFPEFEVSLVSQLRASLDAFLEDVVWSEASDYRQLVQADWTYTNERLEAYYGAAWRPADEGTGLRRSVSAPDQRQGVVTHPLLMSGLAYADSTSPIHRGVFLIRHLLGRTLRPPQEAFTPLSPKLHPDLTTRERIALQTSPKNCQVCHVKINALGFTLENYDPVGRYREKDKDRPVDPAGGYTLRSGKYIKIPGPQGLATLLATSPDAHRAFVERAFEHFVKQPAAAYGVDTLDVLTERFQNNAFNIRELLIEIAVIAATESNS